MRRWIFWLLIIAFIWIVWSRFAEIKNLTDTLARGQIQWVLVAVFLQAVHFVAHAGIYKSAFDTVELETRLVDLVPLVFGSIFVNVVAPVGGTSGAAIFVDDAARRGRSAGRTAAGTVLQLVVDLVAIYMILVIGMIYLFRYHHLQTFEVIAAVLLFAITSGQSGILLMGLWRPQALHRLLTWFQNLLKRIAKRLKRQPFLPEDWAERNAHEFSQAASAISRHPTRLLRAWVIALFSQSINIASLYAIFLAFQQNISLGPLIAGYAMGILFLIVSITPQGIGVVEGVMTLVFTSLGIPAGSAAVISLTYRGLSFWLPLLVGFLLLHRMRSFSVQESSLAKSWNVRIAALLTALMGVINLISAASPTMPGRLALVRQYIPLVVRHGSRLSAALAGFALLLLGRNLWRNKYTAWVLTLIVLVISGLSQLLKGLTYEPALLSIGLAVWLWFIRNEFHALSDRPSIKQGLITLLVALISTLIFGSVGFFLLDRHFSVTYSLSSAVHQTILMFTQFNNPGIQPTSQLSRFFFNSIYIVGAVSVGYALLMLLRPVLVRKPSTPDERERAREIVERFGRSSLANMFLFPDKAYYFSPGGSVVAFTTYGRTALALGDPIGPESDLPDTIEGFHEFCTHNDWQAAFYQVSPAYLDSYREAGYNSLTIGQEAIVNLDSYNLEGRANKPVRTAVNHLKRLGFTAEIYSPPLPNELVAELKTVSDEWLTLMGGKEKRFSMGWFEKDLIGSNPLAVVREPEGMAVAFSSLMSEYNLDEISIDLMRHRQVIPNGTMDFLFVSLFAWARQQGCKRVNLGLSALSGIGKHVNDPTLERGLHFLFEHMNRFYNFKGLFEFKNKFHPDWSPRYLIYAGPANLADIAATLVIADSGGSWWSLVNVERLVHFHPLRRARGNKV
jgi:phosphatidylglycerol lysyltransferase